MIKLRLFFLTSSFFIGFSASYAICGDGKIDIDPNTQQPTEECDLGDANNYDDSNPSKTPDLAETSGCTKNCKVRADGWKCTNTLQDWFELGQTNPRSLKNFFIKLAQQNKKDIQSLQKCTATSTDQTCKDYLTDIAEFKRLNLGNPINVTAQMQCMFDDNSTAISEFADPMVGKNYAVNCGTDSSSNALVPSSS